MRIGVDASCWANGRGYGRFTRELMHAMVRQSEADEWICFADPAAAERFDIEADNVRLVHVSQSESPTRAASADGYRAPSDILRFTRAVWRERPDVFFSPSVYTFFPVPPGIPCVIAIHDAIPERFPELTLPSRRARLFWRGKIRLALAQAKYILTVSEYAARDLVAMLDVPVDRIRVASNAPSSEYRPASPSAVGEVALRHGIPPAEPWFTYVGGFNPHKRVDTLVRAHARLVATGRHVHLVLVGDAATDSFHGNAVEIRDAIRSAGTEAFVHWTGFVADAELCALHSGATALLLVSAAEGFGLPAVEAAACGTPVIATTSSPLPELLEGGGIFVEPGDVDAIEHAMLSLLDDPALRSGLGAQALVRARALDWADGARITLDTLHEAAGRPAAAANGAS